MLVAMSIRIDAYSTDALYKSRRPTQSQNHTAWRYAAPVALCCAHPSIVWTCLSQRLVRSALKRSFEPVGAARLTSIGRRMLVEVRIRHEGWSVINGALPNSDLGEWTIRRRQTLARMRERGRIDVASDEAVESKP